MVNSVAKAGIMGHASHPHSTLLKVPFCIHYDHQFVPLGTKYEIFFLLLEDNRTAILPCVFGSAFSDDAHNQSNKI
jgi:hypothetical protein